MSGAPKKTDSQTLPNKEQALFRQLIKQYESKMYKKGIKTADSILRKCPDNGETLAMKGLLLNCLERKEEAYDLVKKGVKNNLRSHVCWHVYGLLYRSDREYDEAIKCYKNALRMDKDNQTVLRDLANLQIQMRDLSGFLDTRQTIIEHKSTNRQSWVSLALAHHLLGNYEVAAAVLESYESTIEDGEIGDSEMYEHSELLLYKTSILEEGGKYQEALNALKIAEETKSSRDRVYTIETRSRLALKMGDFQGAESGYRALLKINPENYEYHRGLQAAVGQLMSLDSNTNGASHADILPSSSSSSSSVDALLNVYLKLQEEFPSSTAMERLPLDFLDGDDFVVAAHCFIRKYIAKGIPSLFSALKPLYKKKSKADALGALFHGMEDSMNKDGNFPPIPSSLSPAVAQSTSLEAKQQKYIATPQSIVWVQLCLAQHYDILSDTANALKYIDACILHTPTLIEAHTARSKILKHAGDVEGAAEAAQRARRLDLADRYLNCLSVKALFRAGKTERAEAMAGLFTKDGEQSNNLYDMQATWYEIAAGKAYLAKNDLGNALKRFLKVDSHFDDFIEDQFDFHQYCVRKQTMRSYVDMLRMEDRIYRHPIYAKAVHGAVHAYILLFENPPGSKEEEESKKIAAMSPEDAKKYVAMKKKEETKKKKAAAAAAVAAAATEKKGDKEKPNAVKDLDPHGEKLISTPDPLKEATKLVEKLVKAAPDRLESQLLAFEVYSRREKMLLALAALNKAIAIAYKEHPEVHCAVVRFALQVVVVAGGNEPASLSGVAGDIVQEQIKESLLGGKDVATYHDMWVAKHGDTSLAHRCASAKLRIEIDPGNKKKAVDELVNAGAAKNGGHAECAAVFTWLHEIDAEKDALETYRRACAAAFPWSRVFGGALCVELLGDDHDEGNGQGDGDIAKEMEKMEL